MQNLNTEALQGFRTGENQYNSEIGSRRKSWLLKLANVNIKRSKKLGTLNAFFFGFKWIVSELLDRARKPEIRTVIEALKAATVSIAQIIPQPLYMVQTI